MNYRALAAFFDESASTGVFNFQGSISYEVFVKFLKKHKPDFKICFGNPTAEFQHDIRQLAELCRQLSMPNLQCTAVGSLLVSEVFDVRKHYVDTCSNFFGAEIQNPFTFEIYPLADDRSVIQFYQVDDCNSVGLATKELAEKHRQRFIDSVLFADQKTVYLVLKNGDFTEGRGPMSPLLIFSSYALAHTFIMGKEGIFGSKQRFSVTRGINVKGEYYAYGSYNGYEIRAMRVDSVDDIKPTYDHANGVPPAKRMQPHAMIVESLLSLREELLARPDTTTIREILFKINSCLFSTYPPNVSKEVK